MSVHYHVLSSINKVFYFKDKSIGYPNFLLIFYLIFSLNFILKSKKVHTFTDTRLYNLFTLTFSHASEMLLSISCYKYCSLYYCHSPRGLKRTMVNTNFKMKSEVVFKL